MLDFSGDIIESIRKLESILYTSGWNKYFMIRSDIQNEDKLLVSLIREGAIAVGEVYYTFTYDFTEELKEKAQKYFYRLKRKRNMDSIYLNAVNYFSKYEVDIEKTDNDALFYPDLKAYVRCGDLSPQKLLELMKKDGCERVIIFGNGIYQDKEHPWEEFHSFVMQAPKTYILERLEKLEEEVLETIRIALNKAGSDDVIPSIFPKIGGDSE